MYVELRCARQIGRRAVSSSRNQRDLEKERYWRQRIGEAARSGLSIREFCRQQGLKESQFHWWQRTLKDRRRARTSGRPKASQGAEDQARFALVSDGPETLEAGIELVLGDGRRLRIAQGVDEATLRTVLAALGPAGC